MSFTLTRAAKLNTPADDTGTKICYARFHIKKAMLAPLYTAAHKFVNFFRSVIVPLLKNAG